MSGITAAVFAMAERGHFKRMLPIIDGLARAGVTTYVFTAAAFEHEVARAGGRFIDLFADHTVEDADGTSIPVPSRFVSFAGTFGGEVARTAATLGPSLVVHDSFAVVGQVVAHHLGVPRVNVCAGHNLAPAPTLEALGRDPRVRLSDACWSAVERLKLRHGMPDASPFSYVSAVSPDLNLYPANRRNSCGLTSETRSSPSPSSDRCGRREKGASALPIPCSAATSTQDCGYMRRSGR